MPSQREKPKVGFYNFHAALLHKHYNNPKAHAGIERIFWPYNEASKYVCKKYIKVFSSSQEISYCIWKGPYIHESP
jgi:uncharacterized protein (UPF0332 family)